VEANMTTYEIDRPRGSDPTAPPTAARRESIPGTERRLAKDHGRSLARRRMLDRRTSRRRETDQPIRFLPPLD
jgi:hypothetical protein